MNTNERIMEFKKGKVYRVNVSKRSKVLRNALDEDYTIEDSYKIIKNLAYITFVPIKNCYRVGIPDNLYPHVISWSVFPEWCDEL